MDVVARAKNILFAPKSEWPVIAAEPADTGKLYTGYVIPLALIGPIALLVGAMVFGSSISLGHGLWFAVQSFVTSLIAVYVVAFVASKLAPSFAGQDNMGQALKLSAYGYTASMVGGIFLLIPGLGSLLGLLCSLYGLYLLYLGTTPVMGVPESKALGYTVVLVIILIVLGIVVSYLVFLILGVSFMAMSR